MSPSAARLADGLDELSVAAGHETHERLLGFVTLLTKWNRVHNLTAVRGFDDMIVRHLLDSAALAPWLRLCLSVDTPIGRVATESSTPSAVPLVLDIGTGAGVPVLPLALLLPDYRFLSVESNGKKCRFQRQALIELGIGNVEVHEGRIEALASEADVVMARAFTAHGTVSRSGR